MADLATFAFALGCGLAATLAIGTLTWTVSWFKADVSIVDSMWSVLIFGAGAVYAAVLPAGGARMNWVLVLAALWALRLAVYITARNWGEPEDRRYQEIRARNQPGFEWKSLYLVFALQAVLAWIVSLPLLAAVGSAAPVNWLDGIGAAVVIFGLLFETFGDWQLARFKGDPANAGRVMDQGLWRYTRHPNYFGEFCVWWGFFIIALAGGGWWSLLSPLLMSVLLMKVSGVTLLEKDIGERRPKYRDYIARTNAFFPWLPKGGA
jgi:steroid 5-alpha reductase family enzyme